MGLRTPFFAPAAAVGTASPPKPFAGISRLADRAVDLASFIGVSTSRANNPSFPPGSGRMAHTGHRELYDQLPAQPSIVPGLQDANNAACGLAVTARPPTGQVVIRLVPVPIAQEQPGVDVPRGLDVCSIVQDFRQLSYFPCLSLFFFRLNKSSCAGKVFPGDASALGCSSAGGEQGAAMQRPKRTTWPIAPRRQQDKERENEAGLGKSWRRGGI